VILVFQVEAGRVHGDGVHALADVEAVDACPDPFAQFGRGGLVS
jgi:hypothetical protein